MANGFFNVPTPINEPVKGYAPGSPERAELQRELSERQAEIGTLRDELRRALIENDVLGQQLAERSASLDARQEVIASQD